MQWPGAGNYGWATANTSNVWIQTSATTLPQSYPPPATDWEKAKVKAEPDDEFTWLRKRVGEIEELAFA